MKKRILLVDESLTVQKVVALTLDKGRYQINYARSRQEVIKAVLDVVPHLILLSDGVLELPWQSFPKELEAWLGRNVTPPPVILITNQDLREAKHYAACLKKPFTPQNLQAVVEAQMGADTYEEPLERTDVGGFADSRDAAHGANHEEDRLQRVFNNAFSNEESLVKETFHQQQSSNDSNDEAVDDEFEDSQSQTVFDARSPKNRGSQSSRRGESSPSASSLWEEPKAKAAARAKPQRSSPEDLWGMNAAVLQSRAQEGGNEADSQVLSAEDSMAYKSVLESEVQSRLERQDLEEIVSRTLNKLMPPIVEKLVQERLDLLLKEHEESVSP